MRNKQTKRTPPLDRGKTPRKRQTTTKATAEPASAASAAAPAALPPARAANNPNWVDVTGTMPEDIRIDPDITEGHPGYDESGDSEIIPPKRSGKRGTAGRAKKSR